jgi:hypothetical protein
MWRSRRLVCTFALILLASIPFWLHEASDGTLPLGSNEDFLGAGAPRVPTTSLEQDRNAQAARRRDGAPGDGLTDRADEALGKTAAGNQPATTDRLDIVARETSPAAATRGIGDPEADEASPAPDTIYDLQAGDVSREHERVVLDPLWLPAGALSTRITGVDYGAPRKLILWRVDRDRSARNRGNKRQ